MKIQIKIKGMRVFEEVDIVVEKELNVGSGVRFLLHNTRYCVTGQVRAIDVENRLVHVQSAQFNDWIGFDAVRDVLDRDALVNDRLQAQIDYGITDD